jgi:hypothetical protein
MAENLVRPISDGGGWDEKKGPEIVLNINPDAIEKNIRRLEPRLQNMAIEALRRRLDEMQGITKDEVENS